MLLLRLRHRRLSRRVNVICWTENPASAGFLFGVSVGAGPTPFFLFCVSLVSVVDCLMSVSGLGPTAEFFLAARQERTKETRPLPRPCGLPEFRSHVTAGAENSR